jgi:hypothetical protein
MSMDDSDRRNAEPDDIDEVEPRRRYYERLCDWSEPGAVKVDRNGKLVEPLAALQNLIGSLTSSTRGPATAALREANREPAIVR